MSVYHPEYRVGQKLQCRVKKWFGFGNDTLQERRKHPAFGEIVTISEINEENQIAFKDYPDNLYEIREWGGFVPEHSDFAEQVITMVCGR